VRLGWAGRAPAAGGIGGLCARGGTSHALTHERERAGITGAEEATGTCARRWGGTGAAGGAVGHRGAGGSEGAGQAGEVGAAFAMFSSRMRARRLVRRRVAALAHYLPRRAAAALRPSAPTAALAAAEARLGVALPWEVGVHQRLGQSMATRAECGGARGRHARLQLLGRCPAGRYGLSRSGRSYIMRAWVACGFGSRYPRPQHLPLPLATVCPPSLQNATLLNPPPYAHAATAVGAAALPGRPEPGGGCVRCRRRAPAGWVGGWLAGWLAGWPGAWPLGLRGVKLPAVALLPAAATDWPVLASECQQ
jgi:hypothetical protein